jgi:hypothetical protein
MVTWVMDRTSDVDSIVSAFIFVDIAANSTLAMVCRWRIHGQNPSSANSCVVQTWLQALYYMTSYPQYLPILREEAAQVIGECGWTKGGIDRLEKLDSFIRETQRISPLASGNN